MCGGGSCPRNAQMLETSLGAAVVIRDSESPVSRCLECLTRKFYPVNAALQLAASRRVRIIRKRDWEQHRTVVEVKIQGRFCMLP